MRALVDFLTSRRTSWIVLVAAALASAALFVLGTGAAGQTAPPTGLPEDAESMRAAAALDELPGSTDSVALLVFHDVGDDPIDDAALATIADNGPALAELSSVDGLPPATVSDDGRVALLPVPVDPVDDVDERADRAADLRATAADGLPDGIEVLLTGPEGFAVDAAAVFEGADLTLLLTTVIVVAVLLLITYRSPSLWLVPLAVIGVADRLASIVATRVAAAFDIVLDASTTGILSVLVFGAGTNYALLLISRYRDELRGTPDRRAAMASALLGAGPAILASGGTVALSLLTLLAAQLTGNRVLGLACAIGIVIAMAFALLVLPAALVLFGRGLFWPYVPRVGSPDSTERGVWARLGRGVRRRPAVVAIAGAAVLLGLASGVAFAKTGLAQSESFLDRPEAVAGQELLAEAFGAGSASPATIVANAGELDAVIEAAEGVEGVSSAVPGTADDRIASVSVTLEAEAESPEALSTVERLREAVQGVPGADALVGGLDAQALDTRNAAAADQLLIMPLILVVVLVVLLVLLRSIVAPLLLLATVVASYVASVGASWYLFTSIFGFPALDTNVLLLSFLFLVALGVDYNIFLVTRAKDEAVRHGTRTGMVRALAATGGVITSAGILLAAVFAVLGVLPLITLTQIGVIVCVGVLLDTLLVRTLIVPALAFLTGDRFWWPRRRGFARGD